MNSGISLGTCVRARLDSRHALSFKIMKTYLAGSYSVAISGAVKADSGAGLLATAHAARVDGAAASGEAARDRVLAIDEAHLGAAPSNLELRMLTVFWRVIKKYSKLELRGSSIGS